MTATSGAEFFGFRQVMGVEEDRHAFMGDQPRQVRMQGGRGHRVEAGGGLIQKDQGRAVKERAGDGESLFHPAAPMADSVAAAVPQAPGG